MENKEQNAVIRGPIWINESQAAQLNFNLLDGISTDIEHYVKAVEQALPQLPVEDGVVRLDDVWLETSLPRDLLRHILEHSILRWPANVERIRLAKDRFLERPPGAVTHGSG